MPSIPGNQTDNGCHAKKLMNRTFVSKLLPGPAPRSLENSLLWGEWEESRYNPHYFAVLDRYRRLWIFSKFAGGDLGRADGLEVH